MTTYYGPHWVCSDHPNSVRLAKHSNGSGILTLDCNRNLFYIVQTGDIEFRFANIHMAAVINVHIVRTGSHSDTWPASVSWQDNVQPAASIGPSLKDVYTLETVDGGASWVAAPFVEGAPA